MTRKRLVWTGALGTVVLLAATYLIVTLTYRLEQGNSGSVGQGAVFDKDRPDTAIHELRTGSAVQIAISVSNPGALPVVVDRVNFPSPDITTEDVKMIERTGEGPACCLPQDAKPFQTVTLRPDDELMVWLTLSVGGAESYEPCTGLAFKQVEVHYSVLGTPRSQWLPLRYEIMFRKSC